MRAFLLPADKPIQRIVVLLQRPSSRSTSEDQRRSAIVVEKFDELQLSLKKRLEELNRICPRPIPSVTLKLERRFSLSEEINAHILGTTDDVLKEAFSPTVRALVCVLNAKDSAYAVKVNLGQSHLVTIALNSAPTDQVVWSPSIGLSSVLVEAATSNFVQAIEDVILDIALFHSWPSLSKKLSSSSDENWFSLRKVQFALRLKQPPPTTVRNLSGLRYVSFSTLCREQGTVNLGRLVSLWDEFFRSLALVDVARTSLSKPSDHALNEALLFIFKYHRKAGQLSADKLRRVLKPLNAGHYLLVRADSKPRLHKTQIVVSGLFGRRTWKTGCLRILPATDRNRFTAHTRYVSLFKFSVAEEIEGDLIGEQDKIGKERI